MIQTHETYIRKAIQADCPHIRGLINVLAAQELRPDAVTLSEAALARLVAGEDSPAVTFVMVDKEAVSATDAPDVVGAPEKIVGYSFCGRLFSSFRGHDILYIEDIVIDPACQGRGLGKAFMGFLARHALDTGCGKMVWSAETVNEDALHFYAKLEAGAEKGRAHFECERHQLERFAAF